MHRVCAQAWIRSQEMRAVIIVTVIAAMIDANSRV